MTLKLNISYPLFGSQKMVELEEEKKIRLFFDKRIGEEVPADVLGDQFKGYILKITGGFDQDGFAMKQGILTNHRVRIVLDGSTGHYRPKRDGCRKRKSVRGCICGPDLSCINLAIVKKGPVNLPGLTDPDSQRPSTRGPKRANNIRKLWGLSKDEDVRQYVSRKKLPADEKHPKEKYRSPKIQRLITPRLLQRKRRRIALKQRRYEKNKKEASDYAKLLNQIRKDKRAALLSKKRRTTIKGKPEETTKTAGKKADTKTAAKGKTAPAKGPAAAKAKAKVQPKAGGVQKPGQKKAATGKAQPKAAAGKAAAGKAQPKAAAGKAQPKAAAGKTAKPGAKAVAKTGAKPGAKATPKATKAAAGKVQPKAAAGKAQPKAAAGKAQPKAAAGKAQPKAAGQAKVAAPKATGQAQPKPAGQAKVTAPKAAAAGQPKKTAAPATSTGQQKVKAEPKKPQAGQAKPAGQQGGQQQQKQPVKQQAQQAQQPKKPAATTGQQKPAAGGQTQPKKPQGGAKQ